MNAMLFPVFDFVAKHRWLQILLLCITGLIVVRIWIWFHDDGVRKLQKAEQEAATAKEREVVLGTSHQVIEDIEDAKDRAAAAPSTVPVVSGPDELRREAPAIAKVILRDRG